ncbi:hypothetical protein [Candidatus Sororendozoicomonas aggregata]|uniref:hypothetical protein n=1 Tax=Candidatus Sororendozoicomonas aggregata TaxID=3073239 RepID=UPI002ED6320E
MKKVFLYFSFPLLMLWAAFNAHAKASCSDDFRSMSNAIWRERVLLTHNGIFIHKVTGPVTAGGDGSCGAHANGNNWFYDPFRIFWTAGNWRKSLVAYNG